MKSYRKWLANLLTVIFMLSFYACASSPKTTETEVTKVMPDVERIEDASIETVRQASPLTDKYDNVIFTSFKTSDQNKNDYPEALEQFKTSTLSHLRGKNAYKHVDEKTNTTFPGKTVWVDLEILEIRLASFAARFWGGAFAGSSYMYVYLGLTDEASGKVIHKKIISSKTNPFGAAWSVGATDKTLPLDLGQIIGEYIYTVVPSNK